MIGCCCCCFCCWYLRLLICLYMCVCVCVVRRIHGIWFNYRVVRCKNGSKCLSVERIDLERKSSTFRNRFLFRFSSFIFHFSFLFRCCCCYSCCCFVGRDIVTNSHIMKWFWLMQSSIASSIVDDTQTHNIDHMFSRAFLYYWKESHTHTHTGTHTERIYKFKKKDDSYLCSYIIDTTRSTSNNTHIYTHAHNHYFLDESSLGLSGFSYNFFHSMLVCFFYSSSCIFFTAVLPPVLFTNFFPSSFTFNSLGWWCM